MSDKKEHEHWVSKLDLAECRSKSDEIHRDMIFRLYDIQKEVYKQNGRKRRPRKPLMKNPTFSIPVPGTKRDINVNLDKLDPKLQFIIGTGVTIIIIIVGIRAIIG